MLSSTFDNTTVLVFLNGHKNRDADPDPPGRNFKVCWIRIRHYMLSWRQEIGEIGLGSLVPLRSSVGDPDVLGLLDPDSLVRGMDSDPAPSLFSYRCWADWKFAFKNKILTQNFFAKKKKILRLKNMYLRVSSKKKKIEDRSRTRCWIRNRNRIH